VCDALFAEFFALGPVAGSGAWVDPVLTITPNSLGAVRVGMTVKQAQTAARATFDQQGDGFTYPTTLPAGYAHDYIGLGGTGTVRCVGAEMTGSATDLHQTISTPEGFRLGDTVQHLLDAYGPRAHFVGAPASGMTTYSGYVVAESGGNLVFVLDTAKQRIAEIAGGGTDIGPNSCTG
jgi:hypothetical protein